MVTLSLSVGLGGGCQSIANRLPSSSVPPPAASILNDGRVVFAVIRANLASGQQEGSAVGKDIPARRFRTAALVPLATESATDSATVTTDLELSKDVGDDQTPLYDFGFTAADGTWNHLIARSPNQATASASLSIPDDQILDWDVFAFVGTASLPVGVPATASATEYRVTIKVSQQGYTGSYKYVSSFDGSRLAAQETFYDHVLDHEGKPVTLHATQVFPASQSANATSGSDETEVGQLDDGERYEENIKVDASQHLETKDGVCTTQDGLKINYHIDRKTDTGLTQGTSTLPGAITLKTTFTPTWRFTKGELRSATGDVVGSVTMAANGHLVVTLPNGQQVQEVR